MCDLLYIFPISRAHNLVVGDQFQFLCVSKCLQFFYIIYVPCPILYRNHNRDVGDNFELKKYVIDVVFFSKEIIV